MDCLLALTGGKTAKSELVKVFFVRIPFDIFTLSIRYLPAYPGGSQ